MLLRRRPEAGLLGGMLEVPSTEWAETLPPVNEALRGTPVRGEWWAVPGVVAHTFTHFRLESLVYRAIVPADATLTFWADPQRCQWVARRDLDRAALPSVMRKIIAHGLRENRRLGRASAMTQRNHEFRSIGGSALRLTHPTVAQHPMARNARGAAARPAVPALAALPPPSQ